MIGLDQLWPQFWIYLAGFLRIGVMVSLLPGFGALSVSVRIKLVLSVLLTLLVVPLSPVAEPALASPLVFVIEPVIGLLMGANLRFAFTVLQIAGTVIAQSASLSQMLGTPESEPMPAIGQFLSLASVCLAMTLGLHIKLVHYLIHMLQQFPLLTALPLSALTDWTLANVAHFFALAFTLAAPFMVISLLYNVTLGAINRAMPQLMVIFVGAPLTTFGGLFLLLLLAPLLLNIWHGRLDAFLARPLLLSR